MKHSLIALVGLLCLNFANAQNKTLECHGEATDGTKIAIQVCYNPGKVTLLGSVAPCEDRTIKLFIDNNLEQNKNMDSFFIKPDASSVNIATVKTSKSTHAEVFFQKNTSISGNWNYMRAYSVKTGKRYISVDFKCDL